jgi:MspA
MSSMWNLLIKRQNIIRWLQAAGSVGVALTAVAAVTVAVMAATPEPADMKLANSVVDSSDQIAGDGVTIQVYQSDDSARFVPPLDGNPLTHEWFHSWTAGYKITGPKAKNFAGHVAIGYLVGYPVSFNGRLSFDWKTPSLALNLCPLGCGPSVGDLVPQLGVDLAVQNGPGIQSVVAAQGDVQGPEGVLHVSNLHGTATGVVGQLRLRPYVTIQAAHGDQVTTYGPTFTN